MADFLVRRWRLREVLGPYLYTCILDLNGANNIGGFRNDPEILKQHPPFDPALASLAPAALDQVARIAKTLVLGKEELRSIVEERSAKLHSRRTSLGLLERLSGPIPRVSGSPSTTRRVSRARQDQTRWNKCSICRAVGKWPSGGMLKR